MCINATDHRGSTPLHWACYSKSEIAISYLIAWKAEIEMKDRRGMTPLHLAVKSVDELKTARPVRALLIAGANRKARDNEGSLPLDFV